MPTPSPTKYANINYLGGLRAHRGWACLMLGHRGLVLRASNAPRDQSQHREGGGAQNNTITYGISCRCQDGIDDLRDTWRCNDCERYDGHALWALLQSRRGPITKLLATSAFASTSMTVSLMSYPALRQAGWYLIDEPGAVPFLQHNDGEEVELEVDSDEHFWLAFEIVPSVAAPAAGESAEWEDGPFGDESPVVAYPARQGGARSPLRWPTTLASAPAEQSAALVKSATIDIGKKC